MGADLSAWPSSGPLSANLWKVKCLGSTLASKASGILRGVWIETDRLPPIRVVLWEETGLQNRSARFDSLTARHITQVWVAGIPAAL
jgi:hypothetical protein